MISSGGIRNAKDAYERMKAGANLFQIYTPMFIKGPYIASDILSDLEDLMRNDKIYDINSIWC